MDPLGQDNGGPRDDVAGIRLAVGWDILEGDGAFTIRDRYEVPGPRWLAVRTKSGRQTRGDGGAFWEAAPTFAIDRLKIRYHSA